MSHPRIPDSSVTLLRESHMSYNARNNINLSSLRMKELCVYCEVETELVYTVLLTEASGYKW